jgi:inner membrane protease ATP23
VRVLNTFCLEENFNSKFTRNLGPIVVFMMKHLKLSGCDVPPSNILCAPCDMTRAGGFSPDPGAVTLCAGHFFSQQHMESTIVHELMHMYDHCRFKVDWGNLRHHACSEVCLLYSSTQTFVNDGYPRFVPTM